MPNTHSKKRKTLRLNSKKIIKIQKSLSETECEFARMANKIGVSPKLYKCADGVMYLTKLEYVDINERKFEIFDLLYKAAVGGLNHLDPGGAKNGYNVMKNKRGRLYLIDWGDAEILNENDDPLIVSSNTFLTLWNRAFERKVAPNELREHIKHKYKRVLPETSRERILRIRQETQKKQREAAEARIKSRRR